MDQNNYDEIYQRIQNENIIIEAFYITNSELIKWVSINYVFNKVEVWNQDFADVEIKTLIAPAAYYQITRSCSR